MSWKRAIWFTLLLVLGVLVTLAATVYGIVHTKAFVQFVREKVIEQAESATGLRLDIKKMEIHWSKLDIDFYDLRLYGTGGASQPPLFRADHLAIGLKITSILRRKVDFREIVLDHPSLDVRVRANGATNAGKSLNSKRSSNSVDAVFQLAIGHLAIHSGQMDYNDLQIPLFVDLRDVRANVVFNTLRDTYTGSLGYDRGRIVARTVEPIEHAAQLQFVASRSGIDFDPLFVSAGNSHITVHAKLTDYSNPHVGGSYEALLFTEQFAKILNRSALPLGQVSSSGSLRYQGMGHRSFLDSTYVDGRLASSQLLIPSGQMRVWLRSVRAVASLENGTLHIPSLDADLLRGHLNAQAEIRDISGKSATRLDATVRDLSLEELGTILPRGAYKRMHFAGRMNGDAQASWTGGIANIVAHSHVRISAPLQSQAAPGAIPLNGVLDFGYDGGRDTASFGQSHLQTGTTQISLTGTVSKRSNLNLQVGTTDLRELTALVSEMRASLAGSANATPLIRFDIGGSAQFSGRVFGAVRNPSLEGQLSASNVEVAGSRWRSIHANLEASSLSVSAQNVVMQNAQRGQLALNGRVALAEWSWTPASPFLLEASASNLSLADLEHLTGRQYPLSGIASANISVQGSWLHPSGHGSVQILKASAWNEPVNNLELNFEGSGNSIRANTQLQAPAGSITANLVFSPDNGQYDLKVTSSGLKLDEIHALAVRKWGIAGVLAVSAAGRGTLRNPELSAQFMIPQLELRSQSVSNAEMRLDLARQHADFTLHSVIAQGNVEAKGGVDLTGEYNTTASIDLHALPIGPLLASYLPGSNPNLEGQTEIHAELQGPLKSPAGIQAHIQIPTLNLAYQSVKIALASPLRFDYAQGVATLQQTEFKGSGTDLFLRGVIPIKGAASSFSLTASGGLDLSLLQGFTQNLKSSGRVELQINAHGTPGQPEVQGQVRVENVYLSSDSLPVGIEGINGELHVAGTRLEVSKLTGRAGGGTLSVDGFMVYGRQPSFNLRVQAKSVRVRYPEGLRSILDGGLELNGTSSNSALTGRVVIERLSFTERFDLASFGSQFTSSTSSDAFERNMRLNVAIQTSDNLNLTSSQLSMQGAANLNLVGTLANPVVLGRVNLTGGDIFFLGKRYEVQNGSIEFANPIHTDPVVNLNLNTTVDQYNITLNLIGSLDRLRTNYTSNPPLPPADIINLLALGLTAEQSAANATPASVSAESVVAQGVASQLSGKIQKLAGISQLTIDPMAGNNQANPGAQIAIQQRVTGNILVTLSTDVTSTQATTIQLQYHTTRQTYVTVLRDQNGGYAIDIRLHKTF
jgi:translocation and assembly module TamB